ncbi:MAG: isoprenoid biosynthesis glyoxalase ElbB [Deltaproteobacteria bacterium]|nr:isoprenoid biosynthesis glyoxalase ElbB [Deltaproteobacteria bacterium]
MGRGAGKRVGVVLSGCGYLDGSEIQEATVTLLALDREGAKVRAAAPDVEQMHVVDHRLAQPTQEKRNILVEAARIVRGQIVPLDELHACDLDALVVPGGYGVAKNLCSFAVDGPRLQVHPEVERVVREMHAARKPQGFICIAPMIAAKVLGSHHPRLTIGNDPQTATTVRELGGEHVECPVDEIVVDEVNLLLSTPAYMLGPTIAPVAAGIERLIARLLVMA